MNGDILHRPITKIWLALMAATIASTTLAETAPAGLAVTAVMLIAAVKARFIITR